MPKIPFMHFGSVSGHSDNKLTVHQLAETPCEAYNKEQRGRICTAMCKSTQKQSIPTKNQQLKNEILEPLAKAPISRRESLVCCGSSLVAILMSPPPSWADDKSEEEEEGVVGAFKSFFDPNEKTKSGKVLPKGYLKSAREVVKTLRESLKEDATDAAKFRRTADSAKESIRDFLSNWRGQQSVAKEESYMELEKVIRSLARFYSKAGPSAALPEEVKSEIIHDLNAADEFL